MARRRVLRLALASRRFASSARARNVSRAREDAPRAACLPPRAFALHAVGRRPSPSPSLALALALALGLVPVVSPAHSPLATDLVLDDATLQPEGWYLRSLGPHVLTFNVTNDAGADDAPIRVLAVRVRLPEGSLHVPGPEPARFVSGSTNAAGAWVVEPRDLDRLLEPGAGDGVAETLMAETQTGGIAPGEGATFTLHFEVLDRNPWTWSVRTAASAAGDEIQVATVPARVDDGAPHVTVEGLALPIATNASELLFSGTVVEDGSGGSGVALVELRTEGSTNTTLSLPLDRDGAFEGVLDLDALEEGNYTVRLVALDRADNDGGFNGSLVVDRTPPRTTYRTPPVVASRPVVLAWTIEDNVGPIADAAVYRFVNGAWVPIVEHTTARVLPMPALLHGDVGTFRVVPNDLAGNREAHPPGLDAARDLVVLVDVLPPQVLGAQLTPTAFGYRVVVHAQDEDSGLGPATLTLLREGLRGPETVRTLTAEPVDGTYSFDLDTAGLAPGSYGADVAATDLAGHEARASQGLELFVGDVLPMLLGSARAPAGQTAFRKDQPVLVTVIIPVSGQHTVTLDASGLGYTEPLALADDGVAPDARAGDGAFTAKVPVRSGNGLVALVLSARSDSGARGVAQLLVPVDTLRPQIAILEPLADAQVASRVTLKVETLDERPGVRLSRVLVNDEEIATSVTPDAATGGVILLVDAAGLPHGDAFLVVEAVDGAGNVQTAAVTVDVDATPPVLVPRFDGPRAPREQWFTGPFRVDLDASDPESGVTSEQVALGDAPYGVPPLALSSLGAREVHFTATNGVGERSVLSILVGLDAAAPVIVSAKVEVRGGARALVVRAVDDVGIESVEADFGTGWTPLTAVGEEFVLEVPDDAKEAQVRATDPAGNEGATRLKVRQSDVPAASWISVVLVLGLLSLTWGRREAGRWR